MDYQHITDRAYMLQCCIRLLSVSLYGIY